MPKYRLLQGTHIIGSDSNTAKTYEAIRGKDIIETDVDLVKSFGSRRFRKLSEEEVVEEEQEVKDIADEFDSLSN